MFQPVHDPHSYLVGILRDPAREAHAWVYAPGRGVDVYGQIQYAETVTRIDPGSFHVERVVIRLQDVRTGAGTDQEASCLYTIAMPSPIPSFTGAFLVPPPPTFVVRRAVEMQREGHHGLARAVEWADCLERVDRGDLLPLHHPPPKGFVWRLIRPLYQDNVPTRLAWGLYETLDIKYQVATAEPHRLLRTDVWGLTDVALRQLDICDHSLLREIEAKLKGKTPPLLELYEGAMTAIRRDGLRQARPSFPRVLPVH